MDVRLRPLVMMLRSKRPVQSRKDYLVGLRENVSFALFGFTSFRLKRFLKLRLARNDKG